MDGILWGKERPNEGRMSHGEDLFTFWVMIWVFKCIVMFKKRKSCDVYKAAQEVMHCFISKCIREVIIIRDHFVCSGNPRSKF